MDSEVPSRLNEVPNIATPMIPATKYWLNLTTGTLGPASSGMPISKVSSDEKMTRNMIGKATTKNSAAGWR